MVSLVLALNEELRSLAPELLTEPKRAIYRIYRDVRFSGDKSPYKTHTAALFAPQGLGKHARARWIAGRPTGEGPQRVCARPPGSRLAALETVSGLGETSS